MIQERKNRGQGEGKRARKKGSAKMMGWFVD
jgi:hypothetical protein